MVNYAPESYVRRDMKPYSTRLVAMATRDGVKYGFDVRFRM